MDKDEYTNSRTFMQHMLWQTPLDSGIRVTKETVKVLALRKLIFFFFLMEEKEKVARQLWGFPGGSEDKESACNAGDLGSNPGSERSPGEGKGNSFQYSCLGNPMDRGACWATVHGVEKKRTQLSD